MKVLYYIVFHAKINILIECCRSLPINVRREGMSVLLPEVITDEQVAEDVAIGLRKINSLKVCK